jgi:hypothetical protein
MGTSIERSDNPAFVDVHVITWYICLSILSKSRDVMMRFLKEGVPGDDVPRGMSLRVQRSTVD